MKPLIANRLFRWSAAVGLALASTSAAAQIWPGGQPLRVIVPFPGGASTLDSVVRTLAPEMSRALGVPVIVDNRPGAGTVIGVDATAKATDGRTIGTVANSFTVNQTLVKSLPYDALRDLQPVVLMARTANVLAVRPTLPVGSLAELVDYARKNPGRLSYGSFGNGTTAHFAGEMLKSQAGVFIVHIPYRGQGPALTDLLGGNIDMMFGNLPDFLPHIRSGRLKALGTTYLARAPLAPEIPTVAEQGFPGFETDSWYGVIAPASMPKETVERIAAAVNRALDDPATQRNLAERGIEKIGGNTARLGEHIRAEIAKYAKIVRDSGMQID
jgi:tripartite-type tricarboxylate transporter receptor subunit TctC